VQNKVVSDFVKVNILGELPLVLLGNQIIKSGGFTTIDELKLLIPSLN